MVQAEARRFWNSLRTYDPEHALDVLESVLNIGIRSSKGIYYDGVHLLTHPTATQHSFAGGARLTVDESRRYDGAQLRILDPNKNSAAYNYRGLKLLVEIKDSFSFEMHIDVGKNGKSQTVMSEIANLVRGYGVAFKFKPTEKPFIPYCGLFGSISYDFIDQFEDLPPNKEDVLKDPDYELYFLDNLFLTSHKDGKTYIIANALVMSNNREKIYKGCLKTIESYEKAAASKPIKPRKFKPVKQLITTDTQKKDYIEIVEKMKQHILAGDIFQAVPSRTIITNYNTEPLDIYKALRNINPSPYMFFINNQNGILLGSSPEMFLRVQGENEKIVEIRPIAGTKPRGLVNNNINKDLDSRYETELKIDEKELAEHTMLIDLARNDIARISKPGTRYVDEPYVVEKYSHVQHLVSNVRGVLKPDLDALHAYMATMNMGTLTAAPKVEAMKLLRKYEKTKRGFYGGAVGYLTPSGDMDSAILIRSVRIKDGRAYVRVGAGIVHDSNPESEFIETERKARACLNAIESTGD